jgi:hypothetical protein
MVPQNEYTQNMTKNLHVHRAYRTTDLSYQRISDKVRAGRRSGE